jgi:zinc transporter ZupT
MTQNTQQNDSGPLLGLRSTLVLLLGVLTAIGAGVLTYLAQRSLPAATLAAGAGFGAGVMFFHAIIG